MQFCSRFAAAFLVLFFFGCRTVRPPERPVANLFPTLFPMSSLSSLPAQATSAAQVSEILSAIGCLDLLTGAGMLSTELETLARGLSQRGYAEIDASRARTSLRWLVLTHYDTNSWRVIGSFQEYPPSVCRFGLSKRDQPTGTAVLAGGAKPEPAWVLEKPGQKIEMYRVTDAKTKKFRWQMVWSVHDDGSQ